MGINFFKFPGYEDARTSFVLRTQLYLWVCAPKPKGIVLLLSTYIPNARTRECLHIHATPTIKIDANTWLQDPPNPNQAGAACDAGLSVAVATIDPSRAGSSNFTFLRRAVTTIRRLTKDRSSAKISAISFNNIQWHEYISRGWDATTETWRTVVWPKFVADARGPDAGFLPSPGITTKHRLKWPRTVVKSLQMEAKSRTLAKLLRTVAKW
ncbi:hypothetical protein C8J57DRAFT_732993 [Mycena rebaudengoi]|nr:hypothetical protein C8J57DRAFT_732993 [Mycena rebaudengoi]